MLRVEVVNIPENILIGYVDRQETFEDFRKDIERLHPGKEIKLIEWATVDFPDRSEVVAVYVEDDRGIGADMIAYILGDSLYGEICESLSDAAEKDNMIITESVLYDPEEYSEPLWGCYKQKMDQEKLFGKKFWLKGKEKMCPKCAECGAEDSFEYDLVTSGYVCRNCGYLISEDEYFDRSVK